MSHSARFAFLRLIAILLGVFIAPVLAQTSGQIANNSARVTAQWKLEALNIESVAIYEEMVRLRTVIGIKYRGTFPDLSDADLLKAIGYQEALEARQEAKEPQGSYHWARWNARVCGTVESDNALAEIARQCWAKTFAAFQVASEGGIARASFNIGRIYEHGWGTSRSKFLAAEWYVKAAEQYVLDDSRDGALESVEAALNVVPDLPAARRLRARLHR